MTNTKYPALKDWAVAPCGLLKIRPQVGLDVICISQAHGAPSGQRMSALSATAWSFKARS